MTSPLEDWIREHCPEGATEMELQLKLRPATIAKKHCNDCGTETEWAHLGFHQDLPQTADTPFDRSKPVLLCTGCHKVVIVERIGS